MNRAVVVLLVIVTFGGGSFESEASGRSVAVGSLALQIDIELSNPETPCPAGSPTAFQCFARTGSVVVPGLGDVHESHNYVLENGPAGCVPDPGTDAVRLVPSSVVLTVAGKGSVDVSTGGTGCLSRDAAVILIAPETFTITGGSGAYAGASGGGTVETHFSLPGRGFSGADIWTGTLKVPGYAFDLTPPTIKGAKNRTVRVPRGVKRARVKYSVTAVDDVDSTVPVTCTPRSGSRFRLGRTRRVNCSATDTSANTNTATFTVTLKRRR
jgi:HYR domain